MTFSRDTLRRELRARRRAIPAPRADRRGRCARPSPALASLRTGVRPCRRLLGDGWRNRVVVLAAAPAARLHRIACRCCTKTACCASRRGAAVRRWCRTSTAFPNPTSPNSALLPASAMAFVVAPLVAFDARGHRLGMGGGWYDRTFAFRRDSKAPPQLVGAAFAAQQVDTVSPQPGTCRSMRCAAKRTRISSIRCLPHEPPAAAIG